jgi:4-hydroxyproline epimerase
LVVTLAYLGRLRAGVCRIETVCGVVEARLNANGSVTMRNVPSYRSASQVAVEVAGIGRVIGDVAWGGNWFFLCGEHGQQLTIDRIDELTDFAWRTRQALAADGITGADGREIDHIELFGPPQHPDADNRNFVLCPGKAYDRSPCGTGTSAKLACLYADGKLQPGQVWRQESIVGSVFEGRIEIVDGAIYPEITGSAYVNAEVTLVLDEDDPFCHGIPRSWATAST